MAAPYKPHAIANAFLALAEEDGYSLTQMHLQKLVYFAHGWSLALAGTPLIRSRIEAWQYGPVIPDLYQATKHRRGDPILDPVVPRTRAETNGSAHDAPTVPTDDEATWQLVREVWSSYKDLSASKLSSLTHMDGTPWDQVWNANGRRHVRNTPIPDELIEAHFRDLGERYRRASGG